jgi:DNA-binding NtrC family response regulator
MKKTILIIDDDFDSRNILKKNLQNEGYKVALARNESEALMKLSKDE